MYNLSAFLKPPRYLIIIKYIYNPSLIDITFITVEDYISASFCDKKSLVKKISPKLDISNIRLMLFSML